MFEEVERIAQESHQQEQPQKQDQQQNEFSMSDSNENSTAVSKELDQKDSQKLSRHTPYDRSRKSDQMDHDSRNPPKQPRGFNIRGRAMRDNGLRNSRGRRGNNREHRDYKNIPNVNNMEVINTPFGPIPAAALWAMQMTMNSDPNMFAPPPTKEQMSIPLDQRISGGNSAPSFAPDTVMSKKAEIEDQAANGERQLCKYGSICKRPDCLYAHPTPAANAGEGMVLNQKMCPDGVNCKNADCVMGHPSPASNPDFYTNGASAGPYNELCKYYPYCTNKHCNFRHVNKVNVPCKNGAECANKATCHFMHPGEKQKCKFNPCLNSICPFEHHAGQQQNQTPLTINKTWTSPINPNPDTNIKEADSSIKQTDDATMTLDGQSSQQTDAQKPDAQ